MDAVLLVGTIGVFALSWLSDAESRKPKKEAEETHYKIPDEVVKNFKASLEQELSRIRKHSV